MLDQFGTLALALDTVPKKHFTVLVNEYLCDDLFL